MKTTIKLPTPILMLLAMAMTSMAQSFSASPSSQVQTRIRSMYVGTATKTIYNSTTEASLIPASGIGTTNINANIPVAGLQIDLDLKGTYTAMTNASDNYVDFKLKLGKYVIAQSENVHLPFCITTNCWQFNGSMTYRTVGASGTVVGFGMMTFNDPSVNPTNYLTLPVTFKNLANPAITIGTTTNTYVDLTAKFNAVANGSPHIAATNQLNTITCKITTSR